MHWTFINTPLFPVINASYKQDEATLLRQLLELAATSIEQQFEVTQTAHQLVQAVRQGRMQGNGIDALMHEYALSSQEGVVLMCLAEALLRIPDNATRDALIRDKLGSADWSQHLGKSESLFVNASTWGLMLTGRMVHVGDRTGIFKRLVTRSGEPVIRQALVAAMRVMGKQFVTGRTIQEAIKRTKPLYEQGYLHSFDMLGESARTMDDAEHYLAAYQQAIDGIGQSAGRQGPEAENGISVKLSALYPRYDWSQSQRAVPYLVDTLAQLVAQAADYNINLTVDAEEADRLDLSLDIFEKTLSRHPYHGFGLAVQAYLKRATAVIDWLEQTAQRYDTRLMVRLVKGAYWDAEIKRAQERGLSGYPVFTRKVNTDISYLACARKMLASPHIYPQFATHNAHTVAWILTQAGSSRDFEFQRLHGMGEALHNTVVEQAKVRCRIYAPVGHHQDLLAYLVRRLLENGSNSSFVNRLVDEKLPIADIIADPVHKASQQAAAHPLIPLPENLFATRKNARGIDYADYAELALLSEQMARVRAQDREVSTHTDVARYFSQAQLGLAIWRGCAVSKRVACLNQAADLMEQSMPQLMALLQSEAGKTLVDAINEVREAIDFCRYYAHQAQTQFESLILPGPTGEKNQLRWMGRGIFVCISPWNFPLAIFIGQVAAALVAGNAVIAKPAPQTPIIAHWAVSMLHQAGVPSQVLQLATGDAQLGADLVAHTAVAGVAFTGSTQTAWHINRVLAAKSGAIVPFIAETGGQNALLVDSSALPEQVVADVIVSSFQSAGQRCSALRILCLQEEIADKTIAMLIGAMSLLHIGDPSDFAVDVGPVIDADAKNRLQQHITRMTQEATLLYACPQPELEGHFVTPHVFEIKSMDQLSGEVFGPILHIIRFKGHALDEMVENINSTGFGLTFGIHSRIDETIERVLSRINAGNVYVNRNLIGAVVGVQPFGGTGLSGTGFKAGGPHYLQRFAQEQTISVNTTASGGNASLMMLGE